MQPIATLLHSASRQGPHQWTGAPNKILPMISSPVPPLQRKKLMARAADAVDESRPTKRQRIQPSESPSEVQVAGTTSDSSNASLEVFPFEVFCRVLSFVGPTSETIVSLSEVNHSLHKTMENIGKAMLPRAQSYFRTPLARMSSAESSASLLLRHTRACSRVLSDLSDLRSIVDKDIQGLSSEDAQKAMDKAARLLNVGPSLNEVVERQILGACGKCGGKAFKYSKWQLLQSMAQPTNDVTPQALQQRQDLFSKNQERLDQSRLIMQLVVFRNLQLARGANSNVSSFVTSHSALSKQLSTSGNVI